VKASGETRPGAVVPALAAAVLAISTAAVLVRLAGDSDPLVLALWRTLLAGTLLLPLVRVPARRDVAVVALAGLFLALHFWTWFASLHHTSVLRSTILVCLSPMWVGLLEWALWRRAPSRRFFAGVAVALPGVSLLGGGTWAAGGTFTGDALALGGGVLSACYLVAGRIVRARMHVASYAGLVCLGAALWLAVAALATGTSPHLPRGAWLAAAGLALGPQLIGHGGLAYAVRYLPASVVSMAVLLEPVGAAVLAAAVLGEVPGPAGAAGACLVLAGVAVAASSGRVRCRARG
jgi:drug/metabolite transporter (DMT)-like permease